MVYSLTYRRPPHVTNSSRASFNGDEKANSIGKSSTDSQRPLSFSGIPDALSLDRIIGGGTCPVSPTPFLHLALQQKDSHVTIEQSRHIHWADYHGPFLQS